MRQLVRYELLLIVLSALLGWSLLMSAPDSAIAQSEEQTNRTEQSDSETAQEPKIEQTDNGAEEPNQQANTTEGADEETQTSEAGQADTVAPQPSERPSRSEQFAQRQNREILEPTSDGPWQAIINILGALIVIGLGVILFLIVQQNREVSDRIERLESSEETWQGRLTKNEQEQKLQLERIRENISTNSDTLKTIEASHTETQSSLESLHSTLSEVEKRLAEHDLMFETLEDTESEPAGHIPTIDHGDPAELIQKAGDNVASLSQTYENGEPFPIISTEKLTPSQIALLILNRIASDIDAWKADTANSELIQTLAGANQVLKEKLKTIRAQSPPLVIPDVSEIDATTDAEYHEVKNACDSYVSRFEGMLLGYQLGCRIDEAEYNQFLPTFIKDRLCNGLARFVSFEQLDEKLAAILGFVQYEIIPIEIGKTKADSRVHDIEESQQTSYDPGTIVAVKVPGLRHTTTGEIVQKPVVIRGE